jgi:uncharacterized protein (DUF2461 family)
MPRAEKPAPPAAVPYFRPEALSFLRNLARNNDREWFAPRKPIFEAELKEPMLAIIRKVTDAMMEFAPAFVRPAEKCLFRIYRDTRFSANKLPYKTHVAAWWSHQGLEKTSGAGYYFHVSAKEVIIAAGAYMPEKDQLAAIRHWLLDHHAEFRKLLHKPTVRNRQWGLAATLPAAVALKPNLAATLIRYFKIAAPIVDALNTPIAAAQAPRKKVLFGLK